MAHFVFVTWNGGGNQPPALALGTELRSRGHDVRFAGYAAQTARITERGFPFQVLDQSEAMWQSLRGEHLWRRLLDGVLVCRPQLDEIPRLVSDRDDTFLVIDCMLFAALTAAERARLPAAVLVHSAPGALLHPSRILAQEIPAPLNELRAEVGLARLSHLWQAWQFAPALCGTIRALDPLATEVPSTFDYAGPIFDRGPDADWHAPWSPDDPRPLVVVSFSTDQDQRSRIQRTVAGLTGKPYRVLATTSASDVTGIERPENVALVRYVPHADILPGAAVTVSHGGHGTLTASLAHGVPLVCLPSPLIADQVPLAAQVQTLGAGRMLDGEQATPAEIAAAVDEVVATPSFRAAARQLAAIIATQRGTHGAATRLEQLATR